MLITNLIGDNDRIHASYIHILVWVALIFSYFYVAYVYFYTDAVQRDQSEASQMWIPVDMLFTTLLYIYHVSLLAFEKFKSKKEETNFGSYELANNTSAGDQTNLD